MPRSFPRITLPSLRAATAALLVLSAVALVVPLRPTGASGAPPALARWERAADPVQPGESEVLVSLSDSRVLAVGLSDLGVLTAEVYDPRTGQWALGSPPAPTLTPFVNWAALIAGSQCGINCGKVIAYFRLRGPQWQLFDPVTGAWTSAGSPAQTRGYHTSPVWTGQENCGSDCGKLLLIGGQDGCLLGGGGPNAPCAEAHRVDMWDPATSLWRETDEFVERATYRETQTQASGAIALSGPRCGGRCGQVMVVVSLQEKDSFLGVIRSRLFDPSKPDGQRWSEAAPAPMTFLYNETPQVLDDGRVLWVGNGKFALYDPLTDSWTPAADCQCPWSGAPDRTSTLRLPDGRILRVGGGTAVQAAIFDPATTSWSSTPALPDARRSHGAALVAGPNCGTQCGKVLVAGGNDPSPPYATRTTAYLYASPPVVAGITPSEGLVTGGTPVRIGGQYLAGATRVTFGGRVATGLVHNPVDGSLAVLSPSADAPGEVPVVVETPVGVAESPTRFKYLALPPPPPSVPVIDSLDPPNGPVTGATEVRIVGSHLANATGVSFGDIPAVFRYVDGSLVATSPAHELGPVEVRVTTAQGRSGPSLFTYLSLPPPVIGAISPIDGPATGGTAVSITGEHLDGASGVSFGGVPASYSYVGGTLVATTPAHDAGAVTLTVTVPDRGTSASSSQSFTFLPVISGLFPVQGDVAGGLAVKIGGAGLAGTTEVRFGSRVATFSVNGDKEVVATSPPAAAAGAVPVTLVSSGLASIVVGSTSTNIFTYTGEGAGGEFERPCVDCGGNGSPAGGPSLPEVSAGGTDPTGGTGGTGATGGALAPGSNAATSTGFSTAPGGGFSVVASTGSAASAGSVGSAASAGSAGFSPGLSPLVSPNPLPVPAGAANPVAPVSQGLPSAAVAPGTAGSPPAIGFGEAYSDEPAPAPGYLMVADLDPAMRQLGGMCLVTMAGLVMVGDLCGRRRREELDPAIALAGLPRRPQSRPG